jgi:hypothetical protein
MPKGKYEPIDIRFWRFVKKGDVGDCWPWIGYLDPQGYGRVAFAYY